MRASPIPNQNYYEQNSDAETMKIFNDTNIVVKATLSQLVKLQKTSSSHEIH